MTSAGSTPHCAVPDCVAALLQAMIHLAPLPGGGIASADVEVPAAVVQLEQQQQDQKLDFLGPMLPPEVARGIAEGMPTGSTNVVAAGIVAQRRHRCAGMYGGSSV